MSDLIKIGDIRFPANATKEHQEVIIAAKETALKDLSIDEVVEIVTNLFVKAKTMNNQMKVDLAVQSAAVQEITKKIINGKYGGITKKQIELAIEKGSFGEYGEFMGISAVTINQWIVGFFKYQNEFRKKQSDFEQRQKFKDQEEALSRYYKENSEKLMLVRFKREYETLREKSEYQIFDPNAYFYQYLVDKKLIEVPHPRRDYFINEAKEILKREWKAEILRANSSMRTRIRGWLSDFEGTIEGKPKAKQKFYKSVTDLILMDYCKNHIEIGSEFNEIINN